MAHLCEGRYPGKLAKENPLRVVGPSVFDGVSADPPVISGSGVFSFCRGDGVELEEDLVCVGEALLSAGRGSPWSRPEKRALLIGSRLSIMVYNRLAEVRMLWEHPHDHENKIFFGTR